MDLPDPDKPMTTVISPALISILMSSRPRTWPVCAMRSDLFNPSSFTASRAVLGSGPKILYKLQMAILVSRSMI